MGKSVSYYHSLIHTVHTRSPNSTMSLDVYTRNIPLTQKAQFWGNYVSALKGGKDLCAAPEPRITNIYPSIVETLPPTYPGLRQEFGKLETLMERGRRGASLPPTPVLPGANDRINSIGYTYCPVHTEIYGSYRNQDRLGCI